MNIPKYRIKIGASQLHVRGEGCSIKGNCSLISVVFFMLFVVCLVVKPNASLAQTSAVEDSLQHRLSISTEESERIELMNELSSRLSDNDPLQSIRYAKKALALSRGSNNKVEEVKALCNIGVAYYDTQDKRDSSLAYFVKGEQMAEQYGFQDLQSDHLMRLANHYRYHEKDSTKTVDYLLKSIEVSKVVDYNYGTARSYAKLASYYTRYKRVELCDEYLKSAAEYYLKLDNGREEIAHYYDEVGNKVWDYYPTKSMDFYFEGIKYSDSYPNLKVSLAKAYISIDQPESALKYLNEALLFLKTTRYPRVKGIATAKLAEVYLKLNDYDAALVACNEGIELLKTVSLTSQTALPALYRTKAILMEISEDYTTAEELYKRSIDEGRRINVFFEVLKSSVSLGDFYATRDTEKAEEYCSYALRSAKRHNFTSIEIDACNCLYSINRRNSKFEKALGYFEHRNQLNDSLSNLKVEHALDINGQLAQKDKELAEESYLKEIKEEQLTNQYKITRLLLVASCLGIVLIGFLLLGIRRIRNQNLEITNNRTELLTANNNLARSNEELERFAHIASHDLKSPLRSVISFVGLLKRKLGGDVDGSIKEYIGYIENNGTRMSNLIDDILEYSKLSSQDTNANEDISLGDLVDEISELILNNSNDKLVKIEVSDDLPNLNWNYSKIFLLFKNFIENGLKYNESENPIIKIYYSNIDGRKVVCVEDNGIGIEEEYFEKIFVMFSRLHGQGEYTGTGLGLATCAKIVDEFNGKIEVSSEIGSGTIFKIYLPDSIVVN